MYSHRSNGRRCLSVALDAGYVAIKPSNNDQSSFIFDLHGKKLICVVGTIVTLFFISFINLTCLLWFMYKLDWSLFGHSGSKVLRFDHIDQLLKIYKQVTCKEPVYTRKINHTTQVNILTDKQIDMSADQNSILFDDDQILFNTDNFSWKNQTSIDFTDLQSYQFDREIATRVHLSELHSYYIHNKRLNITATNQLTISNVQNTFFHSQNLLLEANRYNRRSVLRLNNYPKTRKKLLRRHQNSSHGNIRFKNDAIFFELPRYPLFHKDYRSESGIYRICICNTTFLFLRSFAHQPCPRC